MKPDESAMAMHHARRFHGPFARWPRCSDGVLAIAMFAVAAFVTEGPGDSVVIRHLNDVPVAALLVFAVASAALYWRRHAPLVVLALAVGGWAATIGSGYADLGAITIVALYSTGRYADRDRWGMVGVAAAIAVATVDGLVESTPWGELVFAAVVLEVSWYVGRRLRLRSERAAQLRREQTAEARRIVTEERTRIARELHDVVAHRVSLMTVQAGAAKAVAAVDLEAAVQAMGAVEEAGRQALDELRHLLGVLRPEADADGFSPQPGLADVPRLVEQTRAAGVDVSLAVDGLPGALPARVELSAYRIVQESLTNVLKHAGPAARSEVRLAADGAHLLVEVLDDGRAATTLPGSGHGTIGMRERALLLGGSLEAGPRPGGGYRVIARLPIGGDPT